MSKQKKVIIICGVIVVCLWLWSKTRKAQTKTKPYNHNKIQDSMAKPAVIDDKDVSKKIGNAADYVTTAAPEEAENDRLQNSLTLPPATVEAPEVGEREARTVTQQQAGRTMLAQPNQDCMDPLSLLG